MNQRSRRLRLTEWAALVDAEVPERALEKPTLSTRSERQYSGKNDDTGEPSDGRRRREDDVRLRRRPQ